MKKHTRFLSLLLSATLLFGALLTGCESSADDDGDNVDTYTRTITFNANDGTASPATTTQSFTVTSESWSTSVTLNANTFTRSGYTFQGWAKSATSKTADYKDKATATFSNDTTLYAVWKSDSYAYSYTITFDGNGGATSSGATTTSQVAEGDSSSVKVTLDTNPFTRSGYVFVGWSSYKTSTSVSYTDGAAYWAYSNITLYAVWVSEAEVLTLTLDANDGSGETKKISVASGQYVYFSSYAGAFTSDHATLTAFNTQADGEGESYSVSSSTKSLKIEADTTLYAVWKENPKITFKGNGGVSADGSTETYQYLAGTYEYALLGWNFTPSDETAASTGSATVRLDANPFTREGYVFKGWSTSQSSTAATYADKASVAAFSKDSVLGLEFWSGKTLYAVWQKIPTITYDMNGGSDDESFSETSFSVTTKEPTAKYSYYDFWGWATSKNATEEEYYARDGKTLASDTTLYAVWGLETIFSNKSVSVARNSTETVATFTLLKSESVKLTISGTVEDYLTYIVTDSSGTETEFGKFNSATSVTKNLSAGTYTLTAKNAEVVGSANTATVTLSGN